MVFFYTGGVTRVSIAKEKYEDISLLQRSLSAHLWLFGCSWKNWKNCEYGRNESVPELTQTCNLESLYGKLPYHIKTL